MLISRDYPTRVIDNAIERIMQITREESLQRVERRNDSGKVTFVIKFDPRLPKVSEILHKNFNVMKRDPEMRDVFEQGTQVAYKRHKNLRDTLCRATIYPISSKPSREQKGFKRCLECIACKYGESTKHFYATANGKKHHVVNRIQCSDRNVVYCIQCRKCNFQYVGKTINELKDRINKHRYSIGTSETPVARHFEQRGHSIEDLKFFGIEKVFGDIFLLGARELYWILELDVIRHGMNQNRTRK